MLTGWSGYAIIKWKWTPEAIAVSTQLSRLPGSNSTLFPLLSVADRQAGSSPGWHNPIAYSCQVCSKEFVAHSS